MTVKELADKLLSYPDQYANVSIGCNVDYGYCLRVDRDCGCGNVFLCDNPEYCDDLVESPESQRSVKKQKRND